MPDIESFRPASLSACGFMHGRVERLNGLACMNRVSPKEDSSKSIDSRVRDPVSSCFVGSMRGEVISHMRKLRVTSS